MLYHIGLQWYIICQHVKQNSYIMDAGDERTFVW